MREALILAAGALVAGCSSHSGMLVCGEAFSLRLQSNEKIESESPVEDFIVHTVSSGPDRVVIYEGNAPQRGGIVHQTGKDWPEVVVVHAINEFGRSVNQRLQIGKPAQGCENPPVPAPNY